MANVTETGNAVNISNFKKGIDYCDSLGGDYIPSNSDLDVANMTAKWLSAKNLQSQVNSTLELSKNPINEREILFEPLKGLTTRVLNSLKSTKASKSIIKDAKGLADALRGINPKVKKLDDGSLNPDFVSTSHLSYVMKAENFSKLVILLGNEPLYAPNEAGLSIGDLTALSTNFNILNEQIGTIIAPLTNARIARNIALYDETDGLWNIFRLCKNYIRSKYSAKSPQATYMNSLKFKKQKI